MKIFIIASLQNQHPELKIKEVLYDNAAESACFAVLSEDGNVGCVDYDQSVYDSVKEDIAKDWQDIRDDEIIINTAWAYETVFKKKTDGGI